MSKVKFHGKNSLIAPPSTIRTSDHRSWEEGNRDMHSPESADLVEIKSIYSEISDIVETPDQIDGLIDIAPKKRELPWYSNFLCNGMDQLFFDQEQYEIEQSSDSTPIPCDSTEIFTEWKDFSKPPKPPGNVTIVHKLVHKKRWFEALEALSKPKNRGVSAVYDENSYTPLLLACMKDAPISVIAALLADDPQSCSMPDVDGNFPLHLACKHVTDILVFAKLLQQYPEAASKRNRNGNSPLQNVLDRAKLSPEWIKKLVIASPTSASFCDKNGELPLHYCGKVAMDKQTVKALVRAYPMGVRKLNRYGAPPVLLACSRAVSLDILKVLLRANPAMANVVDQRGQCSVLALWNQHTQLRKVDPKVQYKEDRRVAVNRRALEKVSRIEDLQGKRKELWEKLEVLLYCVRYKYVDDHLSSASKWKFLHAVAGYGSPPEMINLAVKICKDQVHIKDDNGKIALHHVAEAPTYWAEESNQTSTLSPIDIILQGNLDGALVKDARGRIPLHCALEKGKTWESGVGSLVERYPETVFIPSMESGLYPFMLAAVEKSSDVVAEQKDSLRRKLSLKVKNWKNITDEAKNSLLNEEMVTEDLASLTTVFTLLQQAPLVLTSGINGAPDDYETKVLRQMNMNLWSETRTLRRKLAIMYKEADVMEKMHEIQKASLQEKIDALSMSPNKTMGFVSRHRRNMSSLSSVLRKKSTINIARNKYTKGKVKFIPASIIEFEPTEEDDMRDDYIEDDGTRESDNSSDGADIYVYN